MGEGLSYADVLSSFFHHCDKALLLVEVRIHSLIEQIAAIPIHGFGDGVQFSDLLGGESEADDTRGSHTKRAYAAIGDLACEIAHTRGMVAANRAG